MLDLGLLLSDARYFAVREAGEFKLLLRSDKPNLFKVPELRYGMLVYAAEGMFSLVAEDGVVFAARRFMCRLHGHNPYGVGWYSSGLEPNMECTNCYEDLG